MANNSQEWDDIDIDSCQRGKIEKGGNRNAIVALQDQTLKEICSLMLVEKRKTDL